MLHPVRTQNGTLNGGAFVVTWSSRG